MRILLGALTAVILVTIALAAGRVDRAERDAQLLRQVPAADVSQRGVEYVANQRGTFAVLPAAPLAALTVGQSDVYPQHYRITSRLRDAQLTGEHFEHPVALHSGHLDLAFVVIYLYSLVIIGLSYDLLASDRQSGTLRLLMVQGVTARQLAAGKLLARALFVIVIPLIAAIATFLFASAPAVQIPRLTLWITASVGYGLFWLGLAAHVNVRGRTPAANALRLAVLWIVFVVVTPSIVNLGTRVWFPVPSGVRLDIAMREASRAAVAEGSRTLGRFLEDHPATGTGEEGMRQYYALQEARDRQVAASMRPLLNEFEAQRARQMDAIRMLQFASPAILTQMLLTDLAGTSGHRAQRFAAQASRFQEQWRAHFTPDMLSAPLQSVPLLPTFRYYDEQLSDVVARTAGPLATLITVGLLLVWTALRRFDDDAVTETTWSP